MRPALACAALLTLSACSSEADQARKELTLLEQTQSTPRERCEAARRVVAAELRAGNKPGLEDAQLAERSRCLAIDLAPIEADTPGNSELFEPSEVDKEVARIRAGRDR